MIIRHSLRGVCGEKIIKNMTISRILALYSTKTENRYQGL